MNIGELTATLGVDDSQLIEAEKSYKRYGESVAKAMIAANHNIKRQEGLIEDLEDALTELKDARKGAFSIEEIEKYNRKIKEAEDALKDYEQAGLPAERQTNALADGFQGIVSKLIVAVVAWKTFKAIIESTSKSAEAFESTIEGAKSGLDYFMKSVISANFSGFISGLREAIRAGRDFTYTMAEIASVGREYSLKELDLQNKIEEQRQIMYESDKTSLTTKIKAGEEILNLLKQQADMEIELATRTYQAIAAKTGAKNKLTEDEIKYAIQHYTEIEKVGKEYQALAAIQAYVDGQISRGLTVRNDVIEATSKQWVVLNDYTIKSVEDLEQAIKGLGAAAPSAGKLMEALSLMTEAEKDSITGAIAAVKNADNQFLRESRFIFRMIENMRDASFTKQIKLYDNFYKEIAWLRDKNAKMEVPQLTTPISNMPKAGSKGWFAMTDVTLMQKISAELANIAIKNEMFGDTADTVAQQVIWLEKKLNELYSNPDNWGTADMDAAIEKYKGLKDILKSMAEEGSIANEMFAARMQVMQATAELGMALVDRQIAKLDEQYEKDLAGAGNNAKKKAKIEEEYHKKRNALIRKAAIVEKVAGLFSVAISTAKGVMDALSKVVTAPLAPWIIAMGAVQAAAIAAAPLPGLAKGGVIPPGYPNDSYPALLTSGERVVPPGKLTDRPITVMLEGSLKSNMHELWVSLEQYEKMHKSTT